jgi:hypothetical protein
VYLTYEHQGYVFNTLSLNNVSYKQIAYELSVRGCFQFDKSTPTVVRESRAGSVARRKRRTCVPDKPNYPLNLWSIMKNCIGKELTKIPMPVSSPFVSGLNPAFIINYKIIASQRPMLISLQLFFMLCGLLSR